MQAYDNNRGALRDTLKCSASRRDEKGDEQEGVNGLEGREESLG